MAYDFGKGLLGGAALGFGLGGYNQGHYLNKIEPMEHENYDPYIQRGQRAGGILEDQFGRMSQDPTGYIDDIMGNYRNTPGFQQRLGEALKAARSSAAAGGRAGTIESIGQQAQLEDRLLGQDMQQYLDNVLGVQRTGLSGEQGLYGTGFNATQNLTGDLSNLYGTQEQLGFQNNRQKMQLLSDILKTLATSG